MLQSRHDVTWAWRFVAISIVMTPSEPSRDLPPSPAGKVYDMGSGRENSISIVGAIAPIAA
jgi:hypothetical protein